MPKAKQEHSWKPTAKLIASSVASFVAVLIAKQASEVGWDFTTEDALALQTLLESAVLAGIGGVAALVFGWLKSPSETDGIITEVGDGNSH